ncbi:MAG: hypothetical protein QF886_21580 [Planctomycetota bacterium]|jgi:hypothetical protein|nr:hypothetical protein [Planctomycetota bacterium]
MNTSDKSKWCEIREAGKARFIWLRVASWLGIPALFSTWSVAHLLGNSVTGDVTMLCMILPFIIYSVGTAAWHLAETRYAKAISSDTIEVPAERIIMNADFTDARHAFSKETTRLIPVC